MNSIKKKGISMLMGKKTLSGILLLVLLLFSPLPNIALADGTINVGSHQPFTSLEHALKEVQSGDTIKVHGGQFEGPIHIQKSVSLVGINQPVIKGSRSGTVVTIDTSHVSIKNFKIIGSGKNLNREDAGISVNASHCLISNNTLQDVLFGIYLRRADSTVVTHNNIMGYPSIQLAERGDLIRVWYSDHVRITHNKTRHGRDTVIWFANNVTIKHNLFTRGRYGLHFMYSDSAVVHKNQMLYNSVGAYLMYSRHLDFKHNALAYNRTGSGMGIGLKAMDNTHVSKNAIVDNQIGIYIDNSPRAIRSNLYYRHNTVAYNDVGIQTTYAVPRSHFIANSFKQNFKQIEISGKGSFLDEPSSTWRGNYWSNYSGYDLNNDGFGEPPFRSTDFFATMTKQVPAAKLYTYSPAVQALRLAVRAFPLIRPEPGLKDTQPRMDPIIAGQIPTVSRPSQWPLATAGLALAGLGFFLLIGSSRQSTRSKTHYSSPVISLNDQQNSHDSNSHNEKRSSHTAENQSDEIPRLVEAEDVTKSFGNHTALRNVSFSIQSGESIALWGPNGAGKTTLLRCMLGVLPFRGNIRISGQKVRMESKKLRQKMGFVPQTASFYPSFTVYETLNLLKKLRNVEKADIPATLKEVSLEKNADKKVHALSGGMKQRLALAGALLGDPPLLLLDEPMASLDLDGRRTFIDWLSALHDSGKSLILSTHHTDQIKALAGRVLILDEGKMVRDVSSKKFESAIKTSSHVNEDT